MKHLKIWCIPAYIKKMFLKHFIEIFVDFLHKAMAVFLLAIYYNLSPWQKAMQCLICKFGNYKYEPLSKVHYVAITLMVMFEHLLIVKFGLDFRIWKKFKGFSNFKRVAIN